MPRKKKAFKRENSEGSAVIDPSHLSLHLHHQLQRPQQQQQPPPPRLRSPSRQPQRINSAPSALSHNHAQVPPKNKKSRHLSADEEDRLGRLTHLPVWIDRIRQGRGAAVSVLGQVEKVSLDTVQHQSVCHIDLHCFDTDPSTLQSTPHVLTASFYDPLAQNVFDQLKRIHTLHPPANVCLSGFAAALAPEARFPRVSFDQGKLIMRISDNAHSTAWIEQLQSTMPLPPRTVTPPQQASLDVSQSSDWFATPSLDPPPTVPSVSANAHVKAEQAAAVSTVDVVPTTTSRPNGSVAQTAASSIPLVPRPNQQISNANASANSTANANTGANTNATASRNTSTPALPDTIPRAKKKRNLALHQQPRTLGATEYTPIALVRNGERCNVMGVVVNAGDPRRAAGGSRDLNLKLNIADMSCAPPSRNGVPTELNRSMTVMLFSPIMDNIPHPISAGQVLVLRRIYIQEFSAKPQAVGKRDASWSWAIYDPASGNVPTSASFSLHDSSNPISPLETDHMRQLAIWYAQLQGDQVGALTKVIRPTLCLQEISENLFYDTVVEVLKVYTHSFSPDLYVTDYTLHPLFYRGNDQYLRLESNVQYTDDSEGGGTVYQISLWDNHAEVAIGLRTGDIIRLQNVRAKLNPRGMLVGSLGSASDSGIKIRTLKSTDEARITLEKRKQAFLQRLVDHEETACAEAAERAYGLTESVAEMERSTREELHRDATVVNPTAEQVTSIDQPPTPVVPLGVVTFPTPAQRALQVVQSTGSSSNDSQSTPNSSINGYPKQQGQRHRVDDPLLQAQRQQDGEKARSTTLANPRVAVAPVECKAPKSIPVTPIASVLSTSVCPGMYKIRGRVVSMKPERIEEWARLQCTGCCRLLPLNELFCIECQDEDGEKLSCHFRFALMIEQGDEDEDEDSQSNEIEGYKIPILFHDGSANQFLQGIDAKNIYSGSLQMIGELRKRLSVLVGNQLASGKSSSSSSSDQDIRPIVEMAIHSYPSMEAGKQVRRFAALKDLNLLLPTPNSKLCI